MGLFTKKVNFIPSILPMSPLAYSKEEEVYKDAKKNQANVQLSCGPYKLRLHGIFFDRKENFFSCVANERNPERVLLKSLAR